MTAKIIMGHDQLADLFNIFHDGQIVDAEQRDDQIRITVKIDYLASRIQPSFSRFFLTLSGVKGLRMNGWSGKFDQPTEEIEEFASIFEAPIGILYGKISGEWLQIECNMPGSMGRFVSGDLYLQCRDAVVRDEAGLEYDLDELDAICNDYWREWRGEEPLQSRSPSGESTQENRSNSNAGRATDALDSLLFRRALGLAEPREYIDWAIGELGNAKQSESLAILASLGLDSTSDDAEVSHYFELALEELGGEPLTRQRLMEELLPQRLAVCAAGEINPRQFLKEMDAIYSRDLVGEEGDPLLAIWHHLEEDVTAVEQGFDPFWESEITFEKVGEFIRRVATQYIELRAFRVPWNFDSMYLCKKCGNMGLYEMQAELKKKESILDKILSALASKDPAIDPRVPRCRRCNSTDLLWMSVYSGREEWLRRQKRSLGGLNSGQN